MKSSQHSTAAVPPTNQRIATLHSKSRLQYLLASLLFLLIPSSSTALSVVTNTSNIMNDNDDLPQRCRKVVLPDPVVLEDILKVPGPFQDAEEEENCRRMVVEELTVEEQEVAARTSYAYWAWEQLRTPPAPVDCPTSESAAAVTGTDDENDATRIRMAMREARRHFVGQAGHYESALERFKNTLEWRKVARIDLIKSCFSLSVGALTDTASLTTKTIKLSEEDAAQCAHFEKTIETELLIQNMAVRGHDKENRAIIVKLSRKVKWPSDDETAGEGYQLAQLYIAERAIAVTELRSFGKNENLTAIFDFSTYASANSPPVKVMIDTVTVLQANYPERLGKAIILDAPLWMQAAMKLINPFLAAKTRDKLSVLGSSPLLPLLNLWPLRGSSPSPAEVREETVRSVVDPEQAMPFMLPDATLVSAIDVVQQLKHVPFYELYDYDTPSTVTAQT